MGSAAYFAVIKGSQITIANVGDSRCIVSKNGKAIELSTDHKAFKWDESRRIIKAGGCVYDDKILLMGAPMPVLGIPRVQGSLAISRVIGNFAFKQNKNLPPAEQMAICTPHVESMEITNDVEFLVMGSHYIWECMGMDNQFVVDFVRGAFESGETDLRVICERLVDLCMPGASDNCTAILIQFKHRTSAADEGEGSSDQDIASESSEEPISDAEVEMIARALSFLEAKRLEIEEGSKSS